MPAIQFPAGLPAPRQRLRPPSSDIGLLRSYLGDSGTDYSNVMAADCDGILYSGGTTNSSNFPTQGEYLGCNAGGYKGKKRGIYYILI